MASANIDGWKEDSKLQANVCDQSFILSICASSFFLLDAADSSLSVSKE